MTNGDKKRFVAHASAHIRIFASCFAKFFFPRQVSHSGSEALRFVSKAVEVAGAPVARLRDVGHPIDRKIPRAIIALLPLPCACKCFLNGTSKRRQAREVASEIQPRDQIVDTFRIRTTAPGIGY